MPPKGLLKKNGKPYAPRKSRAVPGAVRGRPTDYDPKYCEAIVKLMTDGWSIAAFAASIKMSEDSIYAWAEKYPDFSEAKKRGEAAAKKWWEDQGRQGMWAGKGFNAAVWIFTMKCRFKYRDGAEVGPQQTSLKDQEFVTEWGGSGEPTEPTKKE